MGFSLKLPEDDRALLAVLAAVYLLTRLPFLTYLPLTQDEAVYAVMAEEQLDAPSLIPAFMGHPASWKPPLFFWAHALFSKLFSGILPLELTYRLPSFLFGLAAVPFLWMLVRNIAAGAGAKGDERGIAFFTVLAFLCSSVSIYPNDAMLTDSLAFLLICSSLWLYTEGRFGDRRFVVCAALAAAAFFTKLVLAFMVPLLAVAYFWFRNDRATLLRPLFMLSLVAVPLSAVAEFLVLETAGLGREVYLADIGGHVVSPQNISGPSVPPLVAALNFLLTSPGPWLLPALFGVWWYWRKNGLMCAWLLLIAFPLNVSYFRPWYYLLVMPPVAYFAALALLRRGGGGGRADAKFAAGFAFFAALSLACCLLIYAIAYPNFAEQRDAGLFLAGKENAAVMGEYAPGIIAYKTITERRELGRPLDFGWVLVPPGFAGTAEFLNYHSGRYEVRQGSFSGMFTTNAIFRKDTNITAFSYFAVVDRSGQQMPGRKVFSGSYIRIYEMG